MKNTIQFYGASALEQLKSALGAQQAFADYEAASAAANEQFEAISAKMNAMQAQLAKVLAGGKKFTQIDATVRAAFAEQMKVISADISSVSAQLGSLGEVEKQMNFMAAELAAGKSAEQLSDALAKLQTASAEAKKAIDDAPKISAELPANATIEAAIAAASSGAEGGADDGSGADDGLVDSAYAEGLAPVTFPGAHIFNLGGGKFYYAEQEIPAASFAKSLDELAKMGVKGLLYRDLDWVLGTNGLIYLNTDGPADEMLKFEKLTTQMTPAEFFRTMTQKTVGDFRELMGTKIYESDTAAYAKNGDASFVPSKGIYFDAQGNFVNEITSKVPGVGITLSDETPMKYLTSDHTEVTLAKNIAPYVIKGTTISYKGKGWSAPGAEITVDTQIKIEKNPAGSGMKFTVLSGSRSGTDEQGNPWTQQAEAGASFTADGNLYKLAKSLLMTGGTWTEDGQWPDEKSYEVSKIASTHLDAYLNTARFGGDDAGVYLPKDGENLYFYPKDASMDEGFVIHSAKFIAGADKMSLQQLKDAGVSMIAAHLNVGAKSIEALVDLVHNVAYNENYPAGKSAPIPAAFMAMTPMAAAQAAAQFGGLMSGDAPVYAADFAHEQAADFGLKLAGISEFSDEFIG